MFSQVAFYAIQRTDEPLQILPHRNLPESRIMPNLPVLISLALDESGIRKPVMLHDGLPPPLAELSAKREAEVQAAWDLWAEKAKAQVQEFIAANPDKAREGEFTITVPFPEPNIRELNPNPQRRAKAGQYDRILMWNITRLPLRHAHRHRGRHRMRSVVLALRVSLQGI